MNKPVFFKKFEDEDYDNYPATEENAKIAEIKNVEIDGAVFDVDIIIDTYTYEDHSTERLFFCCTSKELYKRPSFSAFSLLMTQDRKVMTKIAREIMQVNKLSFVTFEANKFEVIFN